MGVTQTRTRRRPDASSKNEVTRSTRTCRIRFPISPSMRRLGGCGRRLARTASLTFERRRKTAANREHAGGAMGFADDIHDALVGAARDGASKTVAGGWHLFLVHHFLV